MLQCEHFVPDVSGVTEVEVDTEVEVVMEVEVAGGWDGSGEQ